MWRPETTKNGALPKSQTSRTSSVKKIMEDSNLIRPPKPDNYLVWAILTTILCCLPFGIVSIVYATKVDNLYYAGQYEEAQEKAKSAKTWAIVAAGSGLLFLVLYMIVVVMLGVSMAAFD